MNKPLILPHYLPARGSTTADSQFGNQSFTAETDNLSFIMKNNTILYDARITKTIINEKKIKNNNDASVKSVI